MKKVLILIMILCLSACSIETIEKEPTQSPELKPEASSDSVEIIDINMGDIQVETSELKSFKPGSNWSNDHGEYTNELDLQKYRLDANLTGKLYSQEVYLFPGEIVFSFEYTTNQNDDRTCFELYDDEHNLLFSEKVVSGYNEIVYENTNKLYSATISFGFESGSEYLDSSIKHFEINQSEDVYRININQVGYVGNARKIGVFVGHQGDYYEIKNAENDEVLVTLALSDIYESKQTDEYISIGDFSSLTAEGEYYIESSFGYKSYLFAINNNIYNEILEDALNFFTTQRCGIEIDESINPDMQHKACHIEPAKMFTTAEMIDVTGGWHDAGDYGRYVETAVKALSDILIGYMIAPSKEDNMSDILNEARYELEWLFKMQREDGGVYSRAVTKAFAGDILPDEDDELVYLMQVSTSSSAGFAAVMALASKIYEPFDIEFSNKCLEVSLKAYKYLSGATEYNPGLPSEFVAGDYALTDDEYYRFYASIALWFTTENSKYLDDAFTHIDGDFDLYNTYWEPLLAYPTFLYLLKADKNESHYDYISGNFYSYVDKLVDGTERDGYRISLNDNYRWGSNQNVIDRAMILLMGYHLTGIRVYKAIAEEHLDYLLGKNCHNMSFVVGYGERYPHHIHHRITSYYDSEFKGALVGGPNSSLEDEVVRNLFEGRDIGPARIYVDDEDSYSTNEVAIHFNSSLVFVLNYLNQGE